MYSSVDLCNLRRIAEELEVLLVKHLQIAVTRLAPVLCRCKKPRGSPFLIAGDGTFYQLALASETPSSGVLNVCLIQRCPNNPKALRRKTVSIKGHGYYSKLRLVYSPTLPIDVEFFAACSSAIFETGYAWFKDQVDRLVANAEVSLVDDLYAVVKRLLPHEDLLGTLWFATITEDYGFRLIERNVVNKAFELIDRNAKDYGQSTNTFVADLITTRLPRDGLLMNISVNLNRDLEKADLKEAKYRQEGSLYAATMAALYGGDVFTISPIYVSAQMSVLALFPTEFRDPILSVIRAHKIELTNTVEAAAGRIGRAVHIFEQRRTQTKRFQMGTLNKFFMLEPNFFGVGFRLNALLDHLSRWRHNRALKRQEVTLSKTRLLPPNRDEE